MKNRAPRTATQDTAYLRPTAETAEDVGRGPSDRQTSRRGFSAMVSQITGTQIAGTAAADRASTWLHDDAADPVRVWPDNRVTELRQAESHPCRDAVQGHAAPQNRHHLR